MNFHEIMSALGNHNHLNINFVDGAKFGYTLGQSEPKSIESIERLVLFILNKEKIRAIKELRLLTGLRLRECKESVDKLLSTLNQQYPQPVVTATRKPTFPGSPEDVPTDRATDRGYLGDDLERDLDSVYDDREWE